MRIDSGVDEASLAVVRLDGYADQPANDLNARVLAGLRAIPGVQSVAVINAVPFGQQAGAAGIFLDAENKHLGGGVGFRSEERRVGKECVSTCRSRWSP